MRYKYIFKGRHPFRHLALAIPAILWLFGCATVPVTERRSLNLVPDSELLALSLQQYREVLKTSRLSSDRSEVKRVRRVGNRIAQAAEEFLREKGLGDDVEHLAWEFNLIEDDKMVNAWVMPGGKAAVYSGILPVARDDTGLAVVLGHEVAHALAKHGNERMSQGLLVQMGGVALSVAMASQPEETRGLAMAAFGAGASVGILLPYSRLHESEADTIGLILMARAGYDPRAAIPFWQRMNHMAGTRPPEFLSTHPDPETRITDIKAHLPEALKYYRKGQ
jgi:predicted Zn-dependent protease